jgi:sugar/nucleoside kinase (ribokinase family)
MVIPAHDACRLVGTLFVKGYCMENILITGLINVETTLTVDGFPIEYSPVRYPFFGVNSTISGVGFNIAKALTILGNQVTLLSLVGRDKHRKQIYQALSEAGIDIQYVMERVAHTPQSVILFEPTGRRQINVDLKDIQDQEYPLDKFEEALPTAALAVLSNINFSRKLLKLARSADLPIATDVHSISRLDDPYNSDFMAAADILFCSDELLPCSPDEWSEKIFSHYGVNILVIGMGEKGAFLSVRDGKLREWLSPVRTLPVVNTIGAGDAMFACFLHYYLSTKDPILSLRKAMVFSSYKIGFNGAAEGFLSEPELELISARSNDT